MLRAYVGWTGDITANRRSSTRRRTARRAVRTDRRSQCPGTDRPSSNRQSSFVHRPIVKVGVITPPLDPLPVQGGDGCWVLSPAPFRGTQSSIVIRPSLKPASSPLPLIPSPSREGTGAGFYRRRPSPSPIVRRPIVHRPRTNHHKPTTPHQQPHTNNRPPYIPIIPVADGCTSAISDEISVRKTIAIVITTATAVWMPSTAAFSLSEVSFS